MTRVTDLSRTPQTLHESLKASIWFKYGVTSTQCRVALSHTARTDIQTIIKVSGQQMVGEEYSNMYTAILESLARAYHDWKAMSQASTPDLKMERHPIKDATFIPKSEFEGT